MTKQRERRRCAWCGGEVAVVTGAGRPRRYCRPSHRQRAYEARRLARAMGLSPDEVLMDRQGFEALRDRIYALEAALQDVERDLRGRPPLAEYKAAFVHLYAAARPVVEAGLEPMAVLGP